jgi:mannose-6-phosphate isomerase
MAEPLFLRPSFHPRIWGGRQLETMLGYTGLPDGPVGECWGVSAHPNGPSIVLNGLHEGQSLLEVWTHDPAFFGVPAGGEFPLLVKFLDTRDWLSVQVHPNDEEAAAMEGVPLGKTECWYVVHADPGAEIIVGHRAPDQESLRRAIDHGEWDDLLLRRKVSAGDFAYVPSGTVHAAGPGLLLCEVQQNCDTTYRVYDFDRADAAGNRRELHLDKAKAVSRAPFDPATIDTAAPPETVPGGVRRHLVTGRSFSVTHHAVAGDGYHLSADGFFTISVLSGHGWLDVDGQTYPLGIGDHVVLPASAHRVNVTGELELITSEARPPSLT